MKTTLTQTHAAITQHRDVVEAFLIRRAKPYRRSVRANHRILVRTFLATGSYIRAAEASGVSRERVRYLLHLALRHLRECGIAPPLLTSTAREAWSNG
jgi:hypothetical protein